MRSAECSKLWWHCVNRFTRAAHVFITDSNSPVPMFRPPIMQYPVEYNRLVKNFGHPAQEDSVFSGCARSTMLGLLFCYVNDFDHAVLLEQGCLIYGENFFERLIQEYPDADVIIPDGARTPQPIQMGLFIVKRPAIPAFIKGYHDLLTKFTDREMSPEKKIAEICKGLNTATINLGAGRARPVNFSATHFFVKHLSTADLKQFADKVNYALPDFGKTLAEFSSTEYWESRYLKGGHSGSGSRGRLAKFKADFINQFVLENSVQTVIEFGCGDGDQLGLFSLPRYIGLDVSKSALKRCRSRFNGSQYNFISYGELHDASMADLVLSVDVIFCLVEDEVFEKYMRDIFCFALQYVLIYSSDYDSEWSERHVKHRSVTNHVSQMFPDWELLSKVPNLYPYDAAKPDETSFCDFVLFGRKPHNRTVIIPGRAPEGSPVAGR